LARTPAQRDQHRRDHEIRRRHRPSGREAEGDRGEPRTNPHHPRRDRQTDQTARGGPRRRAEVQGPERAPVDGQGPARVQEPRTDRASDRRHERTDRETRGRQRETGRPKGRTPEAARRSRRAPERTRTADGGAGRRRGEAAQGEAGWPAHRTRARDGRNRDVEGNPQATALRVAEANREQTKIQKETDALVREREKVDARVAELDEQIKAADKDLHDVDELASKSDAKVLGIQKEIIALNNEIDQVEERVKGIVLEGDRTKD